MTIFTPAVLVTGSDNRGNEFCYFKSLNGWVDSYNEKQVKDDFIRHYVFPIVQKVYFSDLIMKGAEWVANGCPMELTEEQMHAIEEATALDVVPLAEQVAAEIEGNAEWLDSDMVAESHDPRTPAQIDADAFAAEVVATQKSDSRVGWDWDFTPFPKDMPDINFDTIDEIPF